MVEHGGWAEKYRQRPSWCDSRAALRQVRKGQAEGFKPALFVRGLMQVALFALGSFIQRHKWVVLAVVFLCVGSFSIGIINATIETDIVRLWVPKGGRLEQEMTYEERATLRYSRDKTARQAAEKRGQPLPPFPPYNHERHKRQAEGAAKDLVKEVKAATAAPASGGSAGVPKVAAGEGLSNAESGAGGGFQVVIQTPRHEGQNVLTTKDLLLHAQVLTEIAEMQVEAYGQQWTLADVCFKPPAPKVDLGPISDQVQSLVDKIIPCIYISPLDCFWDGAKPLGPFPPAFIPEALRKIVPSAPWSGQVTWKNLDPSALLNDVAGSFNDLGGIYDLFQRVGINAAYQDRPCLDPLDPECPERAPNFVDHCAMVEAFVEWNAQADGPGRPPRFSLAKAPRAVKPDLPARPSEGVAEKGSDDADYAGEDGVGNAAEAFAAFAGAASALGPLFRPGVCQDYSASVRALLRGPGGQAIAEEAFKDSPHLIPRTPDLGRLMRGGCAGFASKILNWPEELIIGGLKHSTVGGEKRIRKAEAYQSVMMVASPGDLHSRFLNRASAGGKGAVPGWSVAHADNIIKTWQRRFTELLYNHRNNTPDTSVDPPVLRQIHPLASTSIGDMLNEFSKFKPTVIFIGYFLMLVYAGACLGSWRERGVQSCAGLGVAGVLLVTFASVSGLGASSILGIQFNAATTQIVPFLTLGLGVDDMFLLVHAYQDIVGLVSANEIGHLLKETGLSVLLTSISNILAFAVGGSLPVPALRAFCFQTAILVFFNMICILSLFPALIAVDLARRKEKRVDILCCMIHNPRRKAYRRTDYPIHGRPAALALMRNPRPVYRGVESVESRATIASSESHMVLAHPRKPTTTLVEKLTLEYFVHEIYGPFLALKPVKIFVMAAFVVVLILSSVFASRTTLGLELTDVIPSGTAPHDFLTARQKYFSFYPLFGALKGPIDLPNKQLQIDEYQHAITQIPYIVTNKGRLGDMYWLLAMRKWLETLQLSYDADLARGHINGTAIDKDKASGEAKLAYSLICQNGDKVQCDRNGKVRLLEEIEDPKTGKEVSIVRRDGFYNYLTAWVKLDNIMYYVTQANFMPTPPTNWGLPADDYSVLIPPADPLYFSQIPFFMNHLTDTEETVKALRQVRAICDVFHDDGLPNYPHGIPVTFWEQYLHLMDNMLFCVGIITVTVFGVFTLLLMSPWTALLVVFVLFLCIVELSGFMALIGIKMNPISAVSLVVAVGISDEFTVHIALYFLTCMGTRDGRMQATLDHMVTPVLHGGVSTLLGIIMLAFSEFEFIILYFFVVMTGLIIIGLLNGLILLPVLLSLIGPRSEVRALHGGSEGVPPPSPATIKRHIKETGVDLYGLASHLPELAHLDNGANGANGTSNGAKAHSDARRRSEKDHASRSSQENSL